MSATPFSEDEAKAQRGMLTCPEPRSCWAAKQGSNPGASEHCDDFCPRSQHPPLSLTFYSSVALTQLKPQHPTQPPALAAVPMPRWGMGGDEGMSGNEAWAPPASQQPPRLPGARAGAAPAGGKAAATNGPQRQVQEQRLAEPY